MRFDDRLLTVLKLPPGDRHDRAVRWRQLVDLVARAGPNSASPVVAEALGSIRDDAGHVDEGLRAAAARAVAALPLPLGLLEYFVGDKLSVSAPVLAAATLETAQWRALAGIADEETRRFIETLHPDAGASPPDFTETLVEAAPDAPEAEAPAPPSAVPPLAGTGRSLSEVVARIERRRRNREASGVATSASAPAGTESPALFRWECGPGGEIQWVEGAPRGALVGRSIARQNGGSNGIDQQVARAFAMRAPFRDAALRLAGDGPVAGEWKISGVPAFEPGDGRFAGYRGIALRDAAPMPQPPPGEFLADPDSLRELVHEIKTPLNAIMGFAEIIDGQFLGPADRRYRERAADIVGQANLLLSAIDDLDFAAKVQSVKGEAPPRVHLAELIDHGAPSLRGMFAERGAELEIAAPEQAPIAAVEPELADRLVARLCATLADMAEPGERLRLSVDRAGELSRVAIVRPSAAGKPLRAGRQSKAAGADAPAGPASGEGFGLRLVRGLARIAGGDVVTLPGGLALVFPSA